MTAYRGTAYEPLKSEHYAIYATTDVNVAEYFAGEKGKVYTLNLDALKIVDLEELRELLEDTSYSDYADYSENHNLADYPLFGDDGECYSIASECRIDGIIDTFGNIEIYNGIDIEVVK